MGIFDVEKDNYSTMKEALAEISKSTSTINNEKIKINDKNYIIELSLGGDNWLRRKIPMLFVHSRSPRVSPIKQ